MDISIDLNILEAEPAAQYHAKADRYLSSHQLLDFIRCPWLHRKKAVGLIEDTDSASYLIGRAAHTLILEGREAFEAAFALGGPINEKTGKPFGAAIEQERHGLVVHRYAGVPLLDQIDLVER